MERFGTMGCSRLVWEGSGIAGKLRGMMRPPLDNLADSRSNINKILTPLYTSSNFRVNTTSLPPCVKQLGFHPRFKPNSLQLVMRLPIQMPRQS